ncbi:VWA domain-containing protein, partial [Sutterella massiliensis]
MAVRASLALTAALMSIRHVNPALSAFSGRSVFTPIVPHGARSLAPFAKRIGVLKARGSTPLTEALFGAAIALSRTKENKKAVLVLTDGEPNDPWSVASVMKRLRASGIRTYGLGIGVQL